MNVVGPFSELLGQIISLSGRVAVVTQQCYRGLVLNDLGRCDGAGLGSCHNHDAQLVRLFAVENSVIQPSEAHPSQFLFAPRWCYIRLVSSSIQLPAPPAWKCSQNEVGPFKRGMQILEKQSSSRGQ